MKLLRHPVAGLVIFAVLTILLITIYDQGLVENYGITEGDLKPTNFTCEYKFDKFNKTQFLKIARGEK